MESTSNVSLAPPKGWQDFAAVTELETLIWEGLTRREKGGEWAYLGLTSCSSIWELQTGGSMLLLQFTDDRRVEDLQITLTPDNTSGCAELMALIAALKTRFHLRQA